MTIIFFFPYQRNHAQLSNYRTATYLSWWLQAHGSYRLLEVLIEPIHGKKVNVCQEHKRSRDLLQRNISQQINWVKWLKNTQQKRLHKIKIYKKNNNFYTIILFPNKTAVKSADIIYKIQSYYTFYNFMHL